MTSPPTSSVPRNGAELMEQFLLHSPFVKRMDMSARTIEPDHVRILLPYSSHIPTYGDVVHGGAIAALVDVTAMATAWSGAALPEKLRGVTVSLAVDFVDAARSEDLTGEGRVVRRGRTLICCEVDVRATDRRMIAKGLVTYKLG